VQQVYVSQSIKEYTVALGRATRESGMLRLGASPRSMLQLLRAAKATAALAGRDFVLPDDVVSVAEAVLAHRIILDRKAASTGETPQSVIRAVLAKIPVAPEAGEAKASPNGRRPVPARTAVPSAPPLHLR
jgi:MoxR-like ATPase